MGNHVINGNRAALKHAPSVIECITVARKLIASRLKPLERRQELRQLMARHAISRDGDGVFDMLDGDGAGHAAALFSAW